MATMLLRLPSTLRERGVKGPLVIGQYRSEDASREDQGSKGRPFAIDNRRLKTIVKQNPRQNDREISQIISVSISIISDHLKRIGKVKNFDKWVPHEVKEFDVLDYVPFCICEIPMRHFLIE